MDSREYNKLVIARLRKAKAALGLRQADLVDRCKQRGFKTSQSEISKALSETGYKIDTYHVSILCKAMDLNLDDVLSFEPIDEVNIKHKDSPFITDAKHKKFRAFLGDYKGYFYSTLNDEAILNGDFRLYPDPATNQCCVSFNFDTGSNDDNGNPIMKSFIGTAKLSDEFDAICCEMIEENGTGDVSYIIFKKKPISNIKCACSIGMVVTICAGTKKLPVAHKLLICRRELSEEDMSFVSGQLKLNDNTILISESAYKDFMAESKLLPDSFDATTFISKGSSENYYTFKEDDISGISVVDKAKVVNLLRKHSASERYKKVGPKSEEFTFDYLKGSKKQSSSKK